MANLYITNAFSINMLPTGTMVEFRPFKSIEDVKRFIRTETTGCFASTVISAIGHRDMAEVIGRDLGIALPVNRVGIKLVVEPGGDIALVAQYSGPRLPEGATSLPEGAEIRYWLCIPGMEYCTEPI